MKEQIEKLKADLREFIALSKTITPGKWKSNDNEVVELFRGHLQNQLFTTEDDNLATFIARARNISPAMAECLLVSVENFELIHQQTDSGEYAAWDALQQILNLW